MKHLNLMRLAYKTIAQRENFTRLTCLVFLLTTFNGYAQNAITDSIQSKFDRYRKQDLQEKLFVHTDKDFYLAGEVLWMKIYEVDAFFNKPLALSAVAYVEIIDSENKPVLQGKIGLDSCHGNGSFYLPVTINSGKYKLRAYTAWMKNNPLNFFFEKVITIINAQEPTGFSVTQKNDNTIIDFFPEGGNLVNSIPSKVGFKVSNYYGNGVTFSGVIKDESSNVAASFQPYKFGIGSFIFTPVKGHTYTAFVTLADGSIKKQALPVAYDNGYVMQLEKSGNDVVKVNVYATDVSIKASPTVYMFAHTRQSVKAVTSAPFNNGIASFTIDPKLLGEGISQITVFNSEKQPVCERLFFKKPTELPIKITSDQPVYNSRNKISLAISTSDVAGNTKMVDMSMAVYRLDSLQTFDDAGITDYLWLRSDLSGRIESPSWYFNTKSDSAATGIDNLVLTQGWRRFSWDAVLKDKAPVISFSPELKGHIVTGKIVNNKTGQPSPGVLGYLTVPGLKPIFRNALSDKNGAVQFAIKDFYGTPGIIVQTNPDEDSLSHVEIASPFAAGYTDTQLPMFAMPTANPETLLDQSIAAQVQNAYSGKALNLYNPPLVDSLPFYRNATETYPLDKYTRFTTIEEIFREFVPTVNVRKKNGRYRLPVYDDAIENGTFETDPLVLLDGLPVFNLNRLMAYDPLKIKKIELVTRKYFYGSTYFDGIINFVTYKGDLEDYELDPHATVIDYEALQLQREFYSPSYETQDQITSHKPDFRNLLQWVPNIDTHQQGNARISFYSSDLPGKYVGTVQGISTDGQTGSGVVFFEVK